jgi:hypothetical protein
MNSSAPSETRGLSEPSPRRTPGSATPGFESDVACGRAGPMEQPPYMYRRICARSAAYKNRRSNTRTGARWR